MTTHAGILQFESVVVQLLGQQCQFPGQASHHLPWSLAIFSPLVAAYGDYNWRGRSVG